MRCIVVGTSGAGKSTFARAAAKVLGVPHIELDELFWSENWTPRPTEEFVAAVRQATVGERWVADGNYTVVRSVLWPLATHVIWLNFSRTLVFSRVFWRTIQRVALRQRLWHGNRESIRKAFFSRESILLWSLTTHAKNQEKFGRLRAHPEFAHLTWLELKHPGQARALLSELGQAGAPSAP